MKIIILGAGQVGRTAAYHLAREPANEVTVVDLKDELLRDLQDRIDIRTVVGSATQPSILEAAGARDADIFIALTNSGACSTRTLRASRVLVRRTSPSIASCSRTRIARSPSTCRSARSSSSPITSCG